MFITAPENVAWLLNIRGVDNPNSPIPNCHLLIDKKNNLYLICEKKKAKKIIVEKKISEKQVVEFGNFEKLIKDLKGNKMIIDYASSNERSDFLDIYINLFHFNDNLNFFKVCDTINFNFLFFIF